MLNLASFLYATFLITGVQPSFFLWATFLLIGAQLEQTIHLISFLTSPVFLDNIFNEPTTFTSRWEKKSFILSTKDTLTKFGVPVVLENKFSCKFET